MTEELQSKLLKLIEYANKLDIKICGAATDVGQKSNSDFLIFDNASLIGSVQSEPLSNICMLIGNHGNLNKFLLNKAKVNEQEKIFSSYPPVSQEIH
ncbi:hypothetical protein [Psychromonas sp. KJ10-2]|uniref:hypothetical protein n=1 Tax=Psychromonas sp. KJ10-2 TaxID=3391822 RepID=UPI0039B46FF4